MDSILSVSTFKHGFMVFLVAAAIGAVAGSAWYFAGGHVAAAGAKVASKV